MTTTNGTMNGHTTALARVEPASIEPTNLGELQTLAKSAAASRFFGAQSPEQALMIMMAGKDLGLSYTQSLRAFHVIEGRPALSADGMVAVCLAHRDICEYFRVVESDDRHAVVETKRVGNPPRKMTFTIEEAQRAGLVKEKSNWAKWPGRMCVARAKSFLAREEYADLLMGLYDPDELRDSAREERNARVTVDGEIIEPARWTSPDDIAKTFAIAIAEASSPERLDTVAKDIKASGLPRELLMFLSGKSQARRKELEATIIDASMPDAEGEVSK